MANFRKIVIILFLSTLTLSVFPSSTMFAGVSFYANTNDKQEGLTITITINGSSNTQMKGVLDTDFLEVYSILGQRVSRVSLKNSEAGIQLDLSKGLYILKAGKVTQKVVVK